MVNLFKTGDPYDTDNYRGLTINSCLGKVFNNIINNRLNKFLVDNNKITKEQIGFKKKARTSDHIFVMNVLLQKYTKLKKKLYLCFVDFKKAYDSVWRRALMFKLLQTGIRGTFFKLIENMYEGGESSIKMDGLLSKEFTCESGVGQGDVISPNLFNIFINDLPQCLTKGEDTPRTGEKYVNCLMYADDLVVMSLSIEDLQNQIDNLNKYCTEWGLEINKRKTKVMIMAKYGNKKPDKNVMVGNVMLEWTPSYKYLGIELHSNRNMTNCSKNLCNRSWKAIFMLNASLKHLNGTTRTRLLLFDKLVKPILNYDCEVWENILQLPKNKVNKDEFWKKVDTLPFEKLHLRYMKIILGVHSKATNAAVRGELGRYPLALCIVKSMMGFWDHIENEEYANSILKDSKTECMSLIEEPGSWFYTLKQIYEIFDMKWSGIKPEKHDQRKLLENMRRSYEEYWKNSIGKQDNGSGKLSTYRQIKIDFRKEKYLDSIK